MVQLWISPSQWRHNKRDGVSSHRRLDCLLNHLFRLRLCCGDIWKSVVSQPWPQTRYQFLQLMLVARRPSWKNPGPRLYTLKHFQYSTLSSKMTYGCLVNDCVRGCGKKTWKCYPTTLWLLDAHCWATFYQHILTLISAWKINHMPSKVYGEVTYLIPNLKGYTVEFE